ncbi:hypothetical protein ABFV99_13540 [Cytobacillus horneckiae]|uniref:hypothetical protein n=1 Tax=Cytobacillus horneckiae TaxID=549687 RepID=UPI0034D00A3B
MNEFELRQQLLNCTERIQNKVNEYLMDWNQKLSVGVPIEKEFLYDLFGRRLEQQYKKESILTIETPNYNLIVSVGLLVNKDNPFQTMVVYFLEQENQTEYNIEVFLFGNETELLEAIYKKEE